MATAHDLPDCARLLAEARHAAAGLRGGPALAAERPEGAPPPTRAPSTRPDGAALGHWQSHPGHLLLAGTVDQAIVGVAAGHLRETAGERLGVIDTLYVEPAARGVGVGSALAAALLAALADLGCTAVDAPALPGDRETKQRLEAAGFSARLLVLRRRLP